MKKVLQINITANWGSTGKIAEQINECAQMHGWKTYMAYGRHCNPSSSQLIRVGKKLDSYLHYGEQSLFDNEGLCSRGATRKLVRQVDEVKPDIVHLHNIHDHYLNYRILFEYLNKTEIKVVWTFHDFWPVTGHCMHFVSKDCHRYETGCYDCPMQKVYPKTLMDRSHKNYEMKKALFSANKYLTIVPVSEWVGEMTRKSFLKDKPIQVIYNGIDINAFKPTPFSIYHNKEIKARMKGKYVILSVANQWAFDKGLEDYKRISEMLADDEVIALVGVSDDIRHSLPHNIIGISRTNNATELAALYTRADVVTILSSAETFGLTVVESFACGTPAIVYDNSAPPALITPKTGAVVKDKDYKAVYTKIQEFKSSTSANSTTTFKNLHSMDCRQRAVECFDKDKQYEKYVKLYEELLK